MRRTVLIGFLLSKSLFAAVEGVVALAQLGHVALVGQEATQVYSNALGFGVEVGVKINPALDVQLGLRKSSHPGDLSILNPTVSAEFHVSQLSDVDMTIGIGPGLYSYAGAQSNTRFGIQFGGAADVVIEEVLRFGLGLRYHSIFDASKNTPSHWAVLMRMGYTFVLKS